MDAKPGLEITLGNLAIINTPALPLRRQFSEQLC